MKTLPVYNLEFPSYCSEIEIFEYRFFRADDYAEKVLELQHLSDVSSEYHKKPNTGGHEITANVEIADTEATPVLEWSGENSTALEDVLLLLSIFTGRDVFTQLNPGVIIADPRNYQWGGVLMCSIPYKGVPIDPPHECNIGLEEGLNNIYKLIRTDEWQDEYQRGYFLFLARLSFRRQTLDQTFIKCWTIWEHLFATLNRKWMSSNEIQNMKSVEKFSYLLVRYELVDEIDKEKRKKLVSLTKIRNRLVHNGRFRKSVV